MDTFLAYRDECHSLNFVNEINGWRETQVRKSGAGLLQPGAGSVRTLWSSNPGSGKFFRASPIPKRPSPTSNHSEKPKFIKIVRGVGEILQLCTYGRHREPMAPLFKLDKLLCYAQTRRRICSYALEFEPRFGKVFSGIPDPLAA